MKAMYWTDFHLKQRPVALLPLQNYIVGKATVQSWHATFMQGPYESGIYDGKHSNNS